MHKLFLLFMSSLFIACTSDNPKVTQLQVPHSKTPKETVYYLITHAEKLQTVAQKNDPELSERGFKQSKYWGDYFKEKNLESFYTTDDLSSFQTLIPIAYHYKAKVEIYNNSDSMFNQNFWQNTYGKNTIIVGQSGFTPKFVNQIIRKEKYKPINETEYNRLYKVIINKEGKIALDTVVKVDFYQID